MPLLRPTLAMPQLEEPMFLKRLSLSLPLMAIFTGAGLRTYRSLVLQFGWSESWLWIAGTFVGGAVFLFVMTTLHLGYYAQREWWWRAPLFAAIEAGTEIAVSLALTLLGLEVVGSIQATLEDWQSTSVRILFFRVAGITLFSVVLALVSTLVRLLLLKGREIPHQRP
jgi:hypothetical protein